MMTVLPLFLNKLGAGEIILIVVLILVFFGGRKIPELMRGLGRGVREFKDAVNQDYPQEERKDPKESKDPDQKPE